MPFWLRYRSTTWATDFFLFYAIYLSTGSLYKFMIFPSILVKFENPTVAIPNFYPNSWSSQGCIYTENSIWLTWGGV